ncbi:ATP-grasp domain-containing protein [Planococcus lenghuensis]|uniref:Alpha-L-glutamate ligase n=1 Tax=Planococcus lenghuensis TaxID=2213202 RepID=A0A1Q2KXF8_9BACL|nr:alpha-L-glutamate ligase [Planococcus lenghuensis]AQQ52881.1 alpha-L-glutamate ligase [Planococcus lenghuensis]
MIALYRSADAERNQGFIAELKKFGDVGLMTWDDWSESGLLQLADRLHGETVLFRVRHPVAARALEDAGVRLVNRAEVNRIANDKWTAFEMMQLLGLPVIPTFKEPPGYPCVAKTRDGHGGEGVEIWDTPRDADEALIFQPFMEHEADVRVYVIGDEVVGAVKRSGVDSFKANIALGGKAEKFLVSAAQERDVLRIARALKSDYIGIDFLLLPDGRHVFNEIEDPVGARAFYETHEENVAELLCKYLRDKKARGWRWADDRL